MPRIKITLPGKFPFETVIPVRITDLNYGSHVGNEKILAIIHEARVQFLDHHGLAELDFAGVGLIMSDVAIEFKSELLYGDKLIASVALGDLSRSSFDVYYKLEKVKDGRRVIAAIAKTGMVCYDYSRKKIVPVPQKAIDKFAA